MEDKIGVALIPSSALVRKGRRQAMGFVYNLFRKHVCGGRTILLQQMQENQGTFDLQHYDGYCH